MGEKKSSGEDMFANCVFLDSALGDCEKYSALSLSTLLAQGQIPITHKRIADSYMIIKKFYGISTLQTRISNCDRNKLARYDFSPLEYSTIKQINEEISFLKKWSTSFDEKLRKDADEILDIRLRELKYLNANKYTAVSNEFYDGYMALEKYFEAISKY